ncbi:UNVERIFIED_CONTAM: hypothetical protein RMT77_012988 [Armadillidium vulgare]|uniref:Mitochondrial import receptor subunit TOM20-like protein n=1 Tax=Armadillidium nasatum TaxID=96803 RepID=A0A5N5TE48_9CRUS|nr:Mitochondrial import receptor subunit TOM20-like protein [Armadillidium nasatum]RXG59604.1 Mitochondrial import receptor subunit TOM20-like protein [Armadillidium vulgare]
MISKSTLGVCAGVAGAIFLGYCIYFDQKRRNDPNFKRKLRERRKKANKESKENQVPWPNMKDPDEVQKFFLYNIQNGEELLAQGDFETAIDHLSRAVAVCGQPQQLLQVLQQTLPPQVFQMLIHKLPSVGETIMREIGGIKVTEEDVE